MKCRVMFEGSSGREERVWGYDQRSLWCSDFIVAMMFEKRNGNKRGCERYEGGS